MFWHLFSPMLGQNEIRASAEIPLQTMTKCGFCHRGIDFKYSGNSLALDERILSSWVFEACSIVNNIRE